MYPTFFVIIVLRKLMLKVAKIYGVVRKIK